MARKQITQIIDDIDGETLEEGGETVLFSLDGRPYEIDLSAAHAEELRAALQPFIDAGRSVGAAARTVTSAARAPICRMTEASLRPGPTTTPCSNASRPTTTRSTDNDRPHSRCVEGPVTAGLLRGDGRTRLVHEPSRRRSRLAHLAGR